MARVRQNHKTHDSWEPVTNLVDDVPSLVEAYLYEHRADVLCARLARRYPGLERGQWSGREGEALGVEAAGQQCRYVSRARPAYGAGSNLAQHGAGSNGDT